jgi:isocitrate lyase
MRLVPARHACDTMRAARLAVHEVIMRKVTICLLAAWFLTLVAVAQDQPQLSNAEKSAVGYIHTVVTAEREYKKKHGKYATSLAALVGSGSFTRRMARTDRGDYSVHFGGGGNSFSVALTPKTFDAEHRAFFANENGTVRVEADKPATAESPALR